MPDAEPAEHPLLLLRRAELLDGVDHERVLHVAHHRDRRVHARQLFDREDAHEERRARAAERLRHLDPHQAELEEPRHDLGAQLALAIHRSGDRAQPLLGERAHGVAEDALVFA